MLVYKDHCTKIVECRALLDKRKQSVAYALIEIFNTLGTPRLLHMDNGSGFSGLSLDFLLSAFNFPEVIEETELLWSSCRIVNGAPRLSPSQGDIE